ncbi:capsular biosynthesis protein [Methylolobus aquaticus]|nr:capsular biosynthesis protein [Methylolobus aquaticus]
MQLKYPSRLAALLIWLPMSAAAIYYAFIAADRYVSESIITVREAKDSAPLPQSLGVSLAGVSASSANAEVLYLTEYILSLDMLHHLDEKLGLRRLYERDTLDLPYKLFPGTSQEWFLWYYRNRVSVTLDSVTSLLNISVEGFTAQDAQRINQELLAESERFVNEISHQMAREEMEFTETQVERVRERYFAAKRKLIEFQNRNRLFDPVAQAQAKAGLTNELESMLARDEAELKNELTYLNDKSFQVIARKNRIKATSAQLDEERRRLASTEGERLAGLAADFQNLTLDAGFAEEAYRASLQTLEKVRMDTSQELKHLIVIASPTLPQIAQYPRRVYDLATLFVVCLVAYGIARLVVASVEDHHD